MNRRQRRALVKKIRSDKNNPAGKKPVFMENVPSELNVKEGDTFTLKGVKRLEDGSVIYDCKPGEETIFIAGVPKDVPKRKES